MFFLPEIEQTESAYEEKLVNIKDVFNTVNSYTDIMINKSVQSFASWCKIKKVLLFNAPVSRKRKKTARHRNKHTFKKCVCIKK